jgi:two-component system response regulator RegA
MGAQGSRSVRTVLVADDDEALLAACKRSLGRERTVYAASDATTARELAQEHPPDLAIVDLRLGSSSGINLVRELKADHPELCVALISGYLSVASAVAAVRAGADLILFKPITFREIVRRVEDGAPPPEPSWEETPTLARAEWEHITRVLADCNGNVSMAARRLGIHRQSLQRRLRKYPPRA